MGAKEVVLGRLMMNETRCNLERRRADTRRRPEDGLLTSQFSRSSIVFLLSLLFYRRLPSSKRSVLEGTCRARSHDLTADLSSIAVYAFAFELKLDD
ncbi:hypothetical protein BDV93DRAFT_612280 [Ceratobasidium sp. AG-I]|nr:hypothetical protein BDV93DRAFT_612280 [Ceratobasidium sp. AG-I]